MDWATESEYRIIAFQKSFDVPVSNCLSQVLYGPEIGKRYERRLVRLLKKMKMDIGAKVEIGLAGFTKPGKFFFDDIKEVDI